MARVLHDNKVKIKSTGLPAVNSWRDVDANEHKDAINDNNDRILNIELGQGGEVIVASATWVSGYTWDVIADNFPAGDTYYPATPDQLTQDAADGTQWREDLIVATAPVAPDTIGIVEILTGDLFANENLVVAKDYDPNTTYVIKRVLVEPATTKPSDASTTLVYAENVGSPTEYDITTNSANIVSNSTNDPDVGTVSIEATNPLSTDRIEATAPAPVDTADIDNLSYRYKGKADTVRSYFFIKWFLAGVQVGKSYLFNDGKNGFDSSNITTYQTITIDGSKFKLPVGTVDEVQILLFRDSYAGYFIDNINLNVGSGGEIPSVTGIEEAPEDGNLYARINKAWQSITLGVGDMILASVQTVTGAKTFNDTKLLMRNVADTFSSWFTNVNTAARTYTLPDKTGTVVLEESLPYEFAFSDEDTDFTVSVVYTKRMLRAIDDITKVGFSASVAPTGAKLEFDFKINSTTIYTTLPTIDIGEFTTETAAIPQVVNGSQSIAVGDEIEVSITQIGSTIAGSGGQAAVFNN